MPRLLNTLLALPLVFAAFGNGSFVSVAAWLCGGAFVDWANLTHVVVVIAIGAALTVAAYYAACSQMERQYYDARRGEAAQWKCQPDMWLSPELRNEEVRWGCINAAFGSVFGMTLFAIRMHPATAPGLVKLYFDLQDPLYGRLTAFGDRKSVV